MSELWTSEVEEICEKLRVNCVNMAEYHRKRYYHYKGYGKYFRIPMIILASINSTASVGLQPVLAQPVISGITCLIGMCMGILGAIELYLGIQSSMELEIKQSKEFYTLAIEIYKVLGLRRENRSDEGKDFLNSQYSKYIKLVEASNLFTRKMKVDLLTTIPENYIDESRMGTPLPSANVLYQVPRNSLEIDEIRTGLSNIVFQQQPQSQGGSLNDEEGADEENVIEAIEA